MKYTLQLPNINMDLEFGSVLRIIFDLCICRDGMEFN